MRTHVLIERLESLGYLFVTVVEETPRGVFLTAVDPQSYQIDILADDEAVYDRKAGSEFWDIMFIGDESFL